MKARAWLFTLVAVALALAGWATASPAQQRKPVVPAATATGKPQSCIPLSQIRESKIRDDGTIDFIASGGRAWRNTLPNRCGGLRSANAFTYETSLSQLCSLDIIHVLDTAGGGARRGAACGLGQFVPVTLDKR